MVNDDFPCVCKHAKDVHYLGSEACWYCPLTSDWCSRFVGDNLKYLEEQFKEN